MKTRAQKPPAKPSRRKFLFAFIVALAGIAALTLSLYSARQRYLREHPPQPPEVMDIIPAETEASLRMGMKMIAGPVLNASAEQKKALNDLMTTMPRTIDEVVEQQRAMDKILTPEQRRKIEPMRQRVRHGIIDDMLEPARDRTPPDAFAKMKEEIKRRADERISGK